MTVYLVERYLAAWAPDEVRALVDQVSLAAAQMSNHQVRHLRSVVIDADETCLCLFEGPDLGSVQRANHEAGLPVDRIVPAELLPARSDEHAVHAPAARRA